MESESQGCVLAVLVSLDDSFVDLPTLQFTETGITWLGRGLAVSGLLYTASNYYE